MKFLIFFIFTIYSFALEIFIAASANLTYVMPEIVKEFNKNYPNIHIKFITSSSGKLTAQILRGAPYDLFLSANMKYPKFLYAKGIGILPPKIYAKGKLALFSLKYKNLSFQNLKNFSSIAISKPKTTPYGKAGVEFLKKIKIYKNIKNKLVYSETIAGVLSYVKNGVDVGIISNSLIYAKNIKNLGKFYYKIIDTSFYSPINQGVLLINNDAKTFYKFLFSKKAKKIFKKYGYE